MTFDNNDRQLTSSCIAKQLAVTMFWSYSTTNGGMTRVNYPITITILKSVESKPWNRGGSAFF
jgi:hypothetical protein